MFGPAIPWFAGILTYRELGNCSVFRGSVRGSLKLDIKGSLWIEILEIYFLV